MSDENLQSDQPPTSTAADPTTPQWHPTLAPDKSPGTEHSESSSPNWSSSHTSEVLAPKQSALRVAINILLRSITPRTALRIVVTILLGIIILRATTPLVQYLSGIHVVKIQILVISALADALALFALVWLWRGRGAGAQELSGYSPPLWPDTSAASKGKPRIPKLPLVGEIHGLQGYAQGKERGWRFRLQCRDDNGNPFAPLPVEIPIAKDRGGLLENDRVEVKGRWRKKTGIRARRIRNLETGIDIEGAYLQAVARTGRVLVGLGIALIVLYLLSFTNWFTFLFQSFISQGITALLSLSLIVVGVLLVMIVKVKE